jgi:quercetin dioxygenase-like cupin family protein
MYPLQARILTALLLAGLAILVAAAERADSGFVRLRPAQIHWQEVPNSYGVQVAIIAGDPTGKGLYVQRVRFPPHVMDRPHWHPNDRYVTVLQGEWWTGTGADFDPQRAVAMAPGSFMFHPAKALHWDGSKGDEPVIVQIFGLGPADTTLADPTRPMWVRLAP